MASGMSPEQLREQNAAMSAKLEEEAQRGAYQAQQAREQNGSAGGDDLRLPPIRQVSSIHERHLPTPN